MVTLGLWWLKLMVMDWNWESEIVIVCNVSGGSTIELCLRLKTEGNSSMEVMVDDVGWRYTAVWELIADRLMNDGDAVVSCWKEGKLADSVGREIEDGFAEVRRGNGG
ncbi:hypothetical protein RYX36_032382 [Vicia faba]